MSGVKPIEEVTKWDAVEIPYIKPGTLVTAEELREKGVPEEKIQEMVRDDGCL